MMTAKVNSPTTQAQADCKVTYSPSQKISKHKSAKNGPGSYSMTRKNSRKKERASVCMCVSGREREIEIEREFHVMRLYEETACKKILTSLYKFPPQAQPPHYAKRKNAHKQARVWGQTTSGKTLKVESASDRSPS